MPFCKRLLKAAALKRRPVGDLTRFGFFRHLRGHSRRLLARKLLPFGMFIIVLMTMDTADYTEYELTLKVKASLSFIITLRSVVCSSFVVVCGQQLFNKVFKFPKTHSKIFEKFLPLIFQTPSV